MNLWICECFHFDICIHLSVVNVGIKFKVYLAITFQNIPQFAFLKASFVFLRNSKERNGISWKHVFQIQDSKLFCISRLSEKSSFRKHSSFIAKSCSKLVLQERIQEIHEEVVFKSWMNWHFCVLIKAIPVKRCRNRSRKPLPVRLQLSSGL